MIIGLITAYKQLEAEKKIGDKDRADLFGQLQKAEKQIPELQEYKDFVAFLNEYAPDKLDEAKRTANERRTYKLSHKPYKTSKNYFGK